MGQKEYSVMKPSERSNMLQSAKKEWRRPSLRKLPIAATAGSSKGTTTAEAIGSKAADAGSLS
jgi:hypothetical protein